MIYAATDDRRAGASDGHPSDPGTREYAVSRGVEDRRVDGSPQRAGATADVGGDSSRAVGRRIQHGQYHRITGQRGSRNGDGADEPVSGGEGGVFQGFRGYQGQWSHGKEEGLLCP